MSEKGKLTILKIFVLFLFFSSIHLPNISFSDRIDRSVENAHKKSIIQYKKGREAKYLVRLLEGAGISKYIDRTPDKDSLDQYIRILNDYGYFLSKIKTRHWDAERILQRVVSLKPNRAVAHFNIGDLYFHHRFNSVIQGRKNEFHISMKKYKHHYKIYADLIYKSKYRKILPWHVQNVLMGLKHPYVTDDKIQLKVFLYDTKFYFDRNNRNLKKALKNDSNAQLEVARYYFYGLGGNKNYKKALEWYKKAANLKDSDAAYMQGVIYLNGYGVKKDLNKAKKWFHNSKLLDNYYAKHRTNELSYLEELKEAPNCVTLREMLFHKDYYSVLGVMRRYGCYDPGTTDPSHTGRLAHADVYSQDSIVSDLIDALVTTGRFIDYYEAANLLSSINSKADNARTYAGRFNKKGIDHKKGVDHIEAFIPYLIRFDSPVNKRYYIAINYAALAYYYSYDDKKQSEKLLMNAIQLAEALDDPKSISEALLEIGKWITKTNLDEKYRHDLYKRTKYLILKIKHEATKSLMLSRLERMKLIKK